MFADSTINNCLHSKNDLLKKPHKKIVPCFCSVVRPIFHLMLKKGLGMLGLHPGDNTDRIVLYH